MLILIVIFACSACFVVGFVLGDGRCQKVLEEARENLDRAEKWLDVAQKHLDESIQHEKTAGRYLAEANEALEKVDALRRDEIAGGAWVEIGGSYEEPPKAAGFSPSRDPERGADRAEECGAVCGSDAAGGGEADREERSEE